MSSPASREEQRTVLISYQQLRSAADSNREGSSDREAKNPGNVWQPVVRKVTMTGSPPSNHAERTLQSPANDLRANALERELDHKRSAITRLETENLTLLREMTQWKLAEDQRMQQLVSAHHEEVSSLRSKLHKLAENAERDFTKATAYGEEASRRDKETIVVLQQKLQGKEAEVGSLTRRLASIEEGQNSEAQSSQHEATLLAGRVEGLEQLLRDKDREISELQQSMSIFKRQVDDRSLEVLKVSRELEGTKLQLAFCKDECRTRDATIESLKRTASELQTRVATLRDEATASQLQAIEKESAREQLERGSHEATRAFHTELASATSLLRSHEETISELRAQCQRAEAALEQLTGRYDLLSEAHQRKDEQLQRALVEQETLRRNEAEIAERLRRAEDELFAKEKRATEAIKLHASERQQRDLMIESLTARVKSLDDDLAAAKAARQRATNDLDDEQQHSSELQRRAQQQSERLQSMETLRIQVEELQYEVRKKQAQLDEARQQCSDAVRKIALLEKELESEASKRLQLCGEKDSLVDTIALGEAEIRQLRTQIGSFATTEQRCREVEEQLQVKHEELQVLTVAYEELRHHTIILQQEVAQVPRLESSAHDMLQERHHLLSQFEHAQVSLLSEREAVARMTSLAEGTMKQLKEAQDELAVKNAELTVSRNAERGLRDAKHTITQLEREISELRTSLHLAEIARDTVQHEKQALAQQGSLEAAAKEELRNQNAKLAKQLADTQYNLGRTEVRDADLQRVVESVRGENKAILEELSTTKKSLLEAREASSALEAHNDALKRQVETLSSQLKVAEEAATRHVAQLHETQSMVQSLSARLVSAEEQRAALESKIVSTTTLEATIRALQAAMEKKSQESEKMMVELEDARETAAKQRSVDVVRRHVEEALTQSRSALRLAEDKLASAHGEIETLTRRLALADTEKQGFLRDVKRTTEQVAGERRKNETLLSEIQLLETQLRAKAALEGKLDGLSQINEDQRQQLATLRHQLLEATQIEQHDSDQAEQLRQAEVELRNARSTVESKDALLRALQDDLDKRSGQIQKLRKDMLARDEEISQLHEAGEELKRTLLKVTRERDDVIERQRADAAQHAERLEREKCDGSRAVSHVSEVQSQLKQSDERWQVLSAKCRQQEDILHDFRQQLQTVQISKSKLELEHEICTVALREAREELDQTRLQLADARSQQARTATSLAEAEHALSIIEKRHQTELSSRDADVSMLARMIDELKGRAASQRDTNSIAAVREDVLVGEKRALESTVAELRREICALQDLQRQQRALDKSHELSPVRLAHDNAKVVEELREQLRKAEDHVADQQLRRLRLQEEYDQLTHTIESVKAAFASREASLSDEVIDLRRHVQLLVNEKEHLRRAGK